MGGTVRGFSANDELLLFRSTKAHTEKTVALYQSCRYQCGGYPFLRGILCFLNHWFVVKVLFFCDNIEKLRKGEQTWQKTDTGFQAKRILKTKETITQIRKTPTTALIEQIRTTMQISVILTTRNTRIADRATVKSDIICISEKEKGYHNRKDKRRLLGLLFVVRAG